MTLSALRELHALIGVALDDIEAVYHTATTTTSTTPNGSATSQKPTRSSRAVHPYASPPPSPSIISFSPSSTLAPLDFPSLDEPSDPTSPSEALTSHPAVLNAINKIVAAAGQMSMTVQTPFHSICDATMGYNLASCMRLLEAAHIVEILRDAGPSGLHVRDIARITGVEQSKIAHCLRLLATHHFLRELSPDVFTNNRISSKLDTGKAVVDIQHDPAGKYRSTNGVSAFVGLSTDELQKASAYITEAYLLSPNATKNSENPSSAAFNFAFDCQGVGYFNWLEGEGAGAPTTEESVSPALSINQSPNSNSFRLQRFGVAMTGTDCWEVPGAVLSGFDWHNLAPGSTIVDVGGGIGSTSMILAHEFSHPDDPTALGLKFVIQDRPVVVEMGIKAWNENNSEFLERGIVEFQAHNFFLAQPIRDAAVYFLRVILHDWPDHYARQILLRLREAAATDTRLVIAGFILPLACAENMSSGDEDVDLTGIAGAGMESPPSPLLPNLGRASSHGYWMDLTMQATFNGKERTLRETVTLAASAGWKVTEFNKISGSIFGHVVAIPTHIPMETLEEIDQPDSAASSQHQVPISMDLEHDSYISRCTTPTLGSNTQLPSYGGRRTKMGFFRRAFGKWSTPKASAVKKPSPLSAASIASPSLSDDEFTSPRTSLEEPHLSPVAPDRSPRRQRSFAPYSDQVQSSPPSLAHHASFANLKPSISARMTPSSPLATRLLGRKASPEPPVISSPMSMSWGMTDSPAPSRKPLSNKRSEGFLSLSPFKSRNEASGSGGMKGRKIAFPDEPDKVEKPAPGELQAAAMIEKAKRKKARSRTRPASPF
ncbi:hypothetical protein CYLTODRAFT_449741 [Cylindrobasidium torrendii FP15055 ss-10]|uniref:O-methyltransferase C-terminal domain-containing protein n=1 Tax=Cylindrobasidium torrendii FP15055 ss-10 TaxID=1314674 RepID=A0A0D7BQY7_9AGAR|nr:hypothetical protein CYLTODRAFT_449741 [Cylindrobasidium torrendii FP15055 ss-10]